MKNTTHRSHPKKGWKIKLRNKKIRKENRTESVTVAEKKCIAQVKINILTETNTNNINKTCTLLQTTGGKDEPNIVLMRKS